MDFRRPGSKLLIERDGPGHERPRTRRQDAERDAALQAAGYEVRRVRRT